MSLDLAQRFFERFAGLTRAHGTYATGAALTADAKGKMTGRRKTVHEPYTPALWETHLNGTYAIGVVPIREDSTARFGAIDIDVYNIDLRALNARVQKLKLPLIVCRTKSGGAHLYLFTATPVPAELVRGKLTEWAIALGHAGVEIFPKQSKLASETDPVESNTGNWINMPYAEGDMSVRYALNSKTGDALTPLKFLDLADRLAVPDAIELEQINPPASPEDAWFAEGPPCLQILAVRGFGDWDNNGLFNIGVYLLKRYGDDFEAHLPAYNQRFLEEPLTGRDYQGVVNSLRKKKYSYMCKEEPICGVCDKKICQTRDYGVSTLANNPGVNIGEIVKLKTDPVTWIVDVGGTRIEMDTPTLADQRKFQLRVLEVTSKFTNIMKPGAWKKLLEERLALAQEIEVPEDATREGQIWVHLARFCTSKVSGKALDEVLMGKPFTDDAEGRTYFQAADFMQYLQQHKVSGASERDVWRILQRRGARHVSKRLKGKTVSIWDVPAFEKQTEDFSVPRVPTPEGM